MNREQKKAHRRQLRDRAKERELLKAQELEEDDSDEFDVIETGNEEVTEEPVEKYMDSPEVAVVEAVGPTSFDELDAKRSEEERVSAVLNITYDTEMLVRNILHDSSKDPTEKANAIKAVTNDFVGRISSKVKKIAKSIGIVTEEKKKSNCIVVNKGKDGNYRWVGWVSNNFVDWDGDIISEKAHREYVEWFDQNKDVAPVFVSWHTPGTVRKSPVDFAMYENGFLIMSGKLEESEALALMKAQEKTDLGMSHGSFILQRNYKDRRIIDKYRMYECSDLPLENAANPFTDFDTLVKEVGMDKLQYLTEILGDEEKAKAFIDKAGLKQKILQEAEITQAEKTEEPKVEVVEPVAEVKPEPVPEVKSEDIVAKVMKEMDIDGLNAFVAQAKEAMEKVTILEALLKEVRGTQDEKLAEVLTPPVAQFAWSMDKRASQSEDNIVPDEDKKKAAPGVPEGYWLSEATNTTPVPVP